MAVFVAVIMSLPSHSIRQKIQETMEPLNDSHSTSATMSSSPLVREILPSGVEHSTSLCDDNYRSRPPRRTTRSSVVAAMPTTIDSHFQTSPRRSMRGMAAAKKRTAGDMSPSSKPTRKKAATARPKPPPNAKTEPEPTIEECACTICMCDPVPSEVATINGCSHRFCFDCIGQWASHENSCPLCKARFTKIERVDRSKGGNSGRPITKKVKKKDQRSTMNRQALESLLNTIVGSTSGRLENFILSQGATLGGERHSFLAFDELDGDEDEDDEDEFFPPMNFVNVFIQHFAEARASHYTTPALQRNDAMLHLHREGNSQDTAINLADDDTDDESDNILILN